MRTVRRWARAGLIPAGASLLVVSSAACPRAALGADLQLRTARAYEEYAARAVRAFLDRAPDSVSRDILPGGSNPAIRPGGEDGIIAVPGGLIHHWAGTTFIRGVRLQRVVEQSRNYPAYPSIHKSVIAARVLEEDTDRYRVLVRIREGAGGVSAVLEIRSTIHYSSPTPASVVGISAADEIREVKNAGGKDERLLPPGHDSGYLWRAHTLTRYVEDRDGVWVQLETLGLSRRFPPMLGWIIEPIARRLGRRSVETTLQEFQAAVRRAERP